VALAACCCCPQALFTSVGKSSALSRSRAFQPPTLMALNTQAATTDHTGSAGAAAKTRAQAQDPARQMQAVQRRPMQSTRKMLAMLPGWGGSGSGSGRGRGRERGPGVVVVVGSGGGGEGIAWKHTG